MIKTLTPLLSVALAFVIFFFFAKPMYAEIEGVQKETSEYRQAVENATKFNNRLQELIAKRNSFSSLELERLESFVPDDIDEVRALVDLKALAEEGEMEFGNIQVGDSSSESSIEEGEGAVSQQSFATADITFDVVGTYEQVRNLLAEIERSLTLMELVGIEFTSTETDLRLYSMTIRLYAFDTNNEE